MAAFTLPLQPQLPESLWAHSQDSDPELDESISPSQDQLPSLRSHSQYRVELDESILPSQDQFPLPRSHSQYRGQLDESILPSQDQFPLPRSHSQYRVQLDESISPSQDQFPLPRSHSQDSDPELDESISPLQDKLAERIRSHSQSTSYQPTFDPEPPTPAPCVVAGAAVAGGGPLDTLSVGSPRASSSAM